MRIRGEIQLSYKDSNNQVIPIGPPVQNDICWPAWQLMFHAFTNPTMPTRRDVTSQSDASTAHWYLYWGASDIHPTPLNAWYDDDGQVAVSQDTPSYTPGLTALDPDLMVFTASIPAPVGTSRFIRVLGLTVMASGNSIPSILTDAKMTILQLPSAYEQLVGQTLDATYRLYFDPVVNSSDPHISNLFYADTKRLMAQLCNAVGAVEYQYAGLIGRMSSSAYDLDIPEQLGYTGIDGSGGMELGVQLTDAGLMATPSYIFPFTNSTVLLRQSDNTDDLANGTWLKSQLFGGGGYDVADSSRMQRLAMYHAAMPGQTNPLQNIYTQRNNPAGPSQDPSSANIGTMTGHIALDYSGWTDPGFQRLMRVNITQTGTQTSAKYKIETFNFIGGFAGQSWVPRTALIPQALTDGIQSRMTADETVFEQFNGIGGVAYRSPDNVRYVAAFDCSRTRAGISIYDIYTGSKRNFSALTTPALPVTAVADGEGLLGYTFVCCADTGLWRINAAMDTVEQLVSPTGVDKAYQICIKRDPENALWVLFDGGLCKLLNPTAATGSLTWVVHNPTTGSPLFDYTGITDDNWGSVTAMAVDPDLTDDQFLFMTSNLTGGDTSGNYRYGFVWWDSVGGSAVNPTTNGVLILNPGWTHQHLLALSDGLRCIGHYWFLGASGTGSQTPNVYFASYGDNNLSARYMAAQSDSGQVCPAYILNPGVLVGGGAVGTTSRTAGFVTEGVFGSIGNSTINLANGSKEFMLREGNVVYGSSIQTSTLGVGLLTHPLIYLSGSNFIWSYEPGLHCYGVTPFMLRTTNAKYATYRSVFWQSYGWDGAAWVLNDSGTKTCHTSPDVLPNMDGMQISFSNGPSGTSFAINQFFTTAVGMGIFKDNGTGYSSTVSFAREPTAVIPISDNVPTASLGALVDEPVTFTPNDSEALADTHYRALLQNKGLVINRMGDATGYLISDQLIPASTEFDFRFCWISMATGSNGSKGIGLATGTGPYTFGLHFSLNYSTGNLDLYNDVTLVATIPNPDPTKVCRIARDSSGDITCYYDGSALAAASNDASQFVIMTSNSWGGQDTGWYDMKLSYTEGRRVLRIGTAMGSTGSYAPNFSGLTVSFQAYDATVLIGSGSPLVAVLDYTTAGNPIAATGTVKVATGAGWLVFHDSEGANPVGGSVVAHYVLNNL